MIAAKRDGERGAGAAESARPPDRAVEQVLASHLLGGASLVAVAVATGLAADGWSSRLWLPAEGPAADRARSEGLQFRLYSMERLRTGGLEQLTESAWAALSLIRGRSSLIHVHNPLVYGWLRPALSVRKLPVVVHFHSVFDEDTIVWALKGRPSHLIACADFIGRQLEEVVQHRRLDIPVTIATNPVDDTRFHPGDKLAARARLGIGHGRFVVALIGNLAPGKGQHVLIRATAELVRQQVPVEAWLVGEERVAEGFEAELRRLCVTLGVEARVRFLGFRTDVPDVLRASDAVVLPSATEGRPLTVLEAMAAGIPVVASDIPGVLELIQDGRTGFIVPAADVSGYARTLAWIHSAPGEVQAIRDRAMHDIRRLHSPSAFTDKIAAVYASCVSP